MSDSVTISFRVYGTPAPQGSKTAYPNKSNRGARVLLVESSKQARPWRHLVTAVAREAMLKNEWEAIESGPVDVLLVFYRQPSKSTPKWKIQGGRPDIKADLDKLVRGALDALSGVCYRDDAQVVNLQARKVWASTDQPEGLYASVCRVHEFGKPKRRGAK